MHKNILTNYMRSAIICLDSKIFQLEMMEFSEFTQKVRRWHEKLQYDHVYEYARFCMYI